MVKKSLALMSRLWLVACFIVTSYCPGEVSYVNRR